MEWIWALLIVILALRLGMRIYRLWRGPGAIILGAQMAAAEERERRHRLTTHDPSPLAAHAYDFSNRDEATLFDPAITETDRRIVEAVRDFASRSPEGRERFRAAATIDDLYTLVQFAKRASIFALREQSATWVQDAVHAVAIVDPERMDPRDILVLLRVVLHAATRVGADVPALFEAGAALAEPVVADALRHVGAKTTDPHGIRSAAGLEEITTARGAGFAEWDLSKYEPTEDLMGIAMRIREAIERDTYTGEITLATALDPIWFPESARAEAMRPLYRRSTVSVEGTLRAEAHPEPRTQMLLIHVVETKSPEIAATLERLASEPAADSKVTRLALHDRHLFLLATSSATFSDAKPHETAESIARFRQPFADALRQIHSTF